jgi:hypothetical protein
MGTIGMHPKAHTTTNKANNGKGRSFSRNTDGVSSPKNYRVNFNQRKNAASSSTKTGSSNANQNNQVVNYHIQ